ncbi:hypothetical protein P4C99_17470 [Pontiellaceae bacterium B1224]|nr:hypothetical protein [Pontiellaceae bacterium B1224]
MLSQKNLLTLACCLALAITSLFYLLYCTAGNGSLAFTEPDQAQYLQYAQSIAQGHPYKYSAGDGPSTGCTSHLYPFVLATLYKLGARGDNFLTASFILNSLFYFGIAILSWLVAKNVYPRAAPLALFISLISGHTLSAVFSQTDIGFFTLLALATIFATVSDRKWFMLVLIILCGITRPEGAIFSVAFLIAGSTGLTLSRKFKDAPGTAFQSKWFLICGGAGFMAFGSSLLLNYLLTGYTQFMSVSNKGYFNLYPFFGAVEQTLYDLLSLIKAFCFGLPETARQFYHFPLLAGLLAITGILLYPRTEKKIRLYECWLLLCVAGVLATVASSQFQGLSNDRYLAWIFPIWTLYILIGVFELNDRLKARLFLPICCTLLIGFQLVSFIYVASSKYSIAVYLQKQKNFIQQIDETLPQKGRLGSTLGGGPTYHLSGRKLYNLSGINSPDFFDAHYDAQPLRLIDRLKHRPDLRFEYWLADSTFGKTTWAQPFLKDPILTDTDSAMSDPNALAVYPANWSSITNGDTPQLLDEELSGLRLIDSLDIGYCPDERSHNHSVDLRLKNTTIPLCSKHALLGEHDYSEVGRIVMGSESFTIRNVTPVIPLRMVLRTSSTATGSCYTGRQQSSIEHLEMNENLTLLIFMNGKGVASCEVEVANDGFKEVILDIPAESVTSTNLNVTIAGDHISYAYWFYQ